MGPACAGTRGCAAGRVPAKGGPGNARKGPRAGRGSARRTPGDGRGPGLYQWRAAWAAGPTGTERCGEGAGGEHEGVAAGADTFDCVAASRAGRNAAVYTDDGRFNISNARFRRSLDPVTPGCTCYTWVSWCYWFDAKVSAISIRIL